MSRYPITLGLIVVNIIVFLLVFSMPEEMMEQAFELLSVSWVTKIEPWRWLTSLFMHASASHLFFNMLGLYFFGKDLEENTNKARFLAVYFIAGLLGTFVFMLTDASPVVGASGCVFGLLGASMLLNPTKKIHFYVFPLPLGMVAVGFILVESLMAAAGATDITGVAHIAHLAGLATGAIFAFFYDPKQSAKGLVVLIISLVLLIFLGPFFSIITGLGGLVLSVLEVIVGTVLYGLAKLLSFIWVVV
ncbi:MAG: rhomboid family intramembrane serine protease [Candidatus Aenigmatarchaeota archaeon]